MLPHWKAQLTRCMATTYAALTIIINWLHQMWSNISLVYLSIYLAPLASLVILNFYLSGTSCFSIYLAPLASLFIWHLLLLYLSGTSCFSIYLAPLASIYLAPLASLFILHLLLLYLSGPSCFYLSGTSCFYLSGTSCFSCNINFVRHAIPCH